MPLVNEMNKLLLLKFLGMNWIDKRWEIDIFHDMLEEI